MEAEARSEARLTLAAPKPIRLPENPTIPKKPLRNAFHSIIIPNSPYKIQIRPKLCEIRIVKTVEKVDGDSLFRAQNPHINDMIFIEANQKEEDGLLFDNMDLMENCAN